MKDPSLPLQKAIVAALKDALGAGVGVHDRVPADRAGQVAMAQFPFVHIGEDQVLSNADQCHDASTAYCTVHGWSRAVGKAEVKGIMATVCQALDAPLDVEGFGVIGHMMTDLRHMTDADGLTSHSVATFRYRLGAKPS
jgi:hypothetical protein